jgi:type IX secretion system PorP/SprF family membrane protein
MKKFNYIFLTVVLSAALKVNAQQLPLFSQYYYNPFVINPGFTGMSDQTQAYLIHRSQWKDMPGAPVTYALTVDGPVQSEKIGLGMSLFNDQAGMFKRTGLYTSYSYKFSINDEHHIVPGVSVGIIDNTIDFSNASVRDAADPLMYGANQRKTTMDATFGVAYFWNDLSAGISVPQLLGNKVRFMENNTNVYTTLRRHVELLAQYKLVISETNEVRFLPSAVMRYVNGAPFQFDVNANFDWKEMVRAGLSYRHGYSAAANAGVRLNNNLVAGYTYEYMISPLSGYSGGAHEIMLGYTFSSRGTGSYNNDEKIRLLNEELDRLKYQTDTVSKSSRDKDVEHTKEIEELKNRLDGLGSNLNKTPVDEASSDFRKQNVSDYTDENNVIVEPGYYVIMGAYKIKDNATKQKELYSQKEGYNPTLLFNKDKQLHYVNLLYSTDEEAAKEAVKTLKAEIPDAWVFVME